MISADHRARAALSYLCEPAHAAVGALIAQWGAVEALELLQSPDAARLGLPVVSAVPMDRVSDALRRLDDIDARFVVPGDAEWPTQLDDLGDEAPWGLWIRGGGNLRLLALRSVAVVGARAATDYGCRMASAIAHDLVASGWTVVSGGAYGIDAAAHRGALASDGLTVVVLASGIDVPYPAAHEALFDRCASSGVVISEAPPGEVARRWRFLDRNRLIAALARGSVVVEAAHRSGALSTARCAADLGRRVMGVPGPATSVASAGVHSLLQSGAALVTSASDVIGHVAALSDDAHDDGSLPDWNELDEPSRSTLCVMAARRAQSTEQIAVAVGREHPDVLADLVLLEMQGLVVRTPQGWRQSSRGSDLARRHGDGA